MRAALLVMFLVGCSPTPKHRVEPQVCPASGGDAIGSDECLADGDCGGSGVCSCAGASFESMHETRNLCVFGNCRTDVDCGFFPCSPSDSSGGAYYGVSGWYCHTNQDKCTVDGDCGSNQYCMFSPEVGFWACAYGGIPG